jgi:hypothetical protein
MLGGSPMDGVQLARRQPIRLAGAALGPVRQVCTFFRSSDEEYGVVLPLFVPPDECLRGRRARGRGASAGQARS